MALQFYDENQDAFLPDQEFFTHHNGRLGGAVEKLIYVRNDDVGRYYTNVNMQHVSPNYSDDGEYGTSGWGIKFAYGQRRPTEAEWDEVPAGEPVPLPDIGSTLGADTSTMHPIWVRVYCPGGVSAQRRTGQELRLFFYDRMVGA